MISPIPENEPPLDTVIRLIGGKYKSGIIWMLSTNDSMRYSDLRKVLIKDSSPRMLSISLKELESDGLLRRTVVKDNPPWVEYSLTPLGMSLIPILEDIALWGAAYQEMVSDMNGL